MLWKATIALVVATLCSVLVPQMASAEGGGYAVYSYRGYDVVPWFLLDGATRLGVYSRWYVSEYYPYYINYPIYPQYYGYADFVGGCHPIRRPVLGAHGWRSRTVQLCD